MTTKKTDNNHYSLFLSKISKEKIISFLKEYYESINGPAWWEEAEKYLEISYGFPKVYFLQDSPAEDLLLDFHKPLRPLIISICPPSSESSMTKTVVAKGRSNLLKARVPPQYVGLRCPAYQSRSRNNFGIIGMVPDEKYGKGIFSRGVLNVPFFWKQKLKRLVLGSYGLTKHGRSIDELDDFPKGGIFLLKPERDPEFDNLTPYNDYNYIPLKVRLPQNYREFIQTLDGSVLISKSAAEKLRYKKIAYVTIMNPVPELQKKFLLWKKNGIKEGAKVHFQEPLSIARIGKQELAINTSPVEGYVESYELLTPNTSKERAVYRLTLVGERSAELGTKLESSTGLKNTIAGYVPDREEIIVINPDTLKDRALFWEIKETGKAHVYITLSGKDGNISNKNARISNTLIQGIFTFPDKTRKKILEEVFSPKNIVINMPENILDIIENFDINPKKYTIFYPQLYYVRQIKRWKVTYQKNGKTKTRTFTDKNKAESFAKENNGKVKEVVYYNEQLSQFGRAVEALYKELRKIAHLPLGSIPSSLRTKLLNKAYDRLPSFYKNALDLWVKSWASRLIIGDPGKSTQIKLRGWMRIVLFDSNIKVNEIGMSKELWETMGKPAYVIWYKEPVSRPESFRCLKVKIDKELKEHPQVVRIHPALGMNYDTGTMRAKVDSDGDLAVLIPINECIKELQYPFNKEEYKSAKEALKMYKNFEDLPEPEYDYFPEELVKELTCYNRYLTQEAGVIEWFGGLKNRAMYTDIIKNPKEWNEFMKQWDIELKAMQAEKFIEGFKEMDYCQKAEILNSFLSEARKSMVTLPPRNPFAEEWLNLSKEITFKDRHKIRKMIKKLKKQKHPVLKLYWQIYKNSPLKI